MPLLTQTPLSYLSLLLVILMVLSAFFSASETGIMSMNKYRLKHLAKTSRKAKRVYQLLLRPDRLLGVILIGNNFVNIAASAIATIIGIRLFGDLGVIVATIVLTLIILIFAEITPKTLAALKPEQIAYPASLPLKGLLWVLYPAVWLANSISNGLLRCIGINQTIPRADPLTQEELKTVVNEANTLISTEHQKMLLGILDLEQASVNDIMIPKNEIMAINLADLKSEINKQLTQMQHTILPVYESQIDNIKGIVHARAIMQLLAKRPFSIVDFKKIIMPPYFIPEGTSLQAQLLKFRQTKNRFGLVVDEYGLFLGIATLSDILEEIVGKFTTDVLETHQPIHPQPDGTFLVDGSITIRELNKLKDWKLPTLGASTLSGMIIAYLETIPDVGTCVLIENHPIEVISIQDNMIKIVRISNPRHSIK